MMENKGLVQFEVSWQLKIIEGIIIEVIIPLKVRIFAKHELNLGYFIVWTTFIMWHIRLK